MKGNLSWPIFWSLIGVFVATASVFFIPALREWLMGFVFLITSGTLLFVLGVVLVFLTIKEKVSGILKKFLILTGASSAGFFVSFILHNAIYGVFIHFLGADFWDRIGIGDEPFFFIMAVFVCPVGFIVGTVGRIVLAIKEARMVRTP
ncbi:hypothetical protein ACFLWY_04355 [Chloroflexota bacterium]